MIIFTKKIEAPVQHRERKSDSYKYKNHVEVCVCVCGGGRGWDGEMNKQVKKGWGKVCIGKGGRKEARREGMNDM